MMVFGIAYRLLPMFLPGEPAGGRDPWLSAVILEVGTISLFLGTILEVRFTWLFSILIVAGILLFLRSAIQTMTKRKHVPPPLPPRPDFSMLHAPFSFFCLLACAFLGILLILAPANEQTLRLALAYGSLGLIGFLGEIVTGLKPKILSIFTWYHAFLGVRSGNAPRPVDMPVRTFQISVFLLWISGLPLLLAGILWSSAYEIRAGRHFFSPHWSLATLHEFTIVRLISKKYSTKMS